MINSVFVLFAALVVFAFGYRFFSKFLAVWVFRSDATYSIPVPAAADSADPISSTRHMPLAQHIGSLAAAVTIIGSTLAVAWGWIPVFLWVTVGSVVAAGAYAMGSHWLARLRNSTALASQARDLAGRGAGALILTLLTALSVLVNAIMAIVVAEVLVTYPKSTIPFLMQAVIALGLGFLVRRHFFGTWTGTLIALAAVLLSLWLFREMPLDLVGQLQVQSIAGGVLILDARVAWIALVFIFAWYGARLPPWKLALPYGLLSTGLLTATLLILFVAVMVTHPTLSAPAFHMPGKAPGTIPWLFVTVTSGAIGGWHALVAGGIETRPLGDKSDARRLGYGGAIADATIALSAILIGSSAFHSQHAWAQTYGSWDNVNHLGQILRIYIGGFALFAHALGISGTLARSLGAMMLMCLSTTTLISGIRIQRRVLEEVVPAGTLPPTTITRILGLGALITAAMAAQASRGNAMDYWPMFGSAGMTVVAAFLALMVLALVRRRRPLVLALALLLLVVGVGIWILTLELLSTWSGSRWGLTAISLVLMLAMGAIIWQAGTVLYRSLPGRRG
ncbi:MAG: carbon starvation CstA family protein [Acidiferrobacterales bacterium]